MSRISIDVTEEEHKRLKALAALKGVTLKEYMLDRALNHPAKDEEQALEELGAFLRSRMEKSKESGTSSHTVDEIFDSVLRRKKKSL